MPRKPKARQPIKDAALQLFVDQGINATGIREIAKAAQCSEAALYRHWANKDDLVRSLYDEHLNTIIALLDKHLTPEADTVEAIQSACRELFAFYDEHPLLFRFVMLVRHELTRYAGDFRQPHDCLAEFFQAKGWPDDAALHQAAAAIGMFLINAEFIVGGILEGDLLPRADIVCHQLAAICALNPQDF